MMRDLKILILLSLVFTGILLLPVHARIQQEDWGYFGHRRINRLAVFTLPPQLIVLFKNNIEYITEQATAPDKRRYASKFEAIRHYIDIDVWDEYPFEKVPRNWTSAILKHTAFKMVSGQTDTTLMKRNQRIDSLAFRRFFQKNILSQYYEEEWKIPCDTAQIYFENVEPDCLAIIAQDSFSQHGILPYHLIRMQNNLTDAFVEKDPERILRLGAEMGHYIADAHVPLHTTRNYNGQLTGQRGIHAFWESRIPELFADGTYDFLVGKASYIEDPAKYYWDIVLTSHQLVDEVLTKEKQISQSYPEDLQYCYENRLTSTVRVPCRNYAQAYQESLNGMVERRMRAAILAVGSAWYTAWVDAGSPDFSNIEPLPAARTPEAIEKYKDRKQIGRSHDN